MNKIRTILAVTAFLLCGAALSGQDVRTLETRVADLLAGMPADSREHASALMEEMYSLGDEGTAMICRQVVPAGQGDDVRARYAISSLTAYLSGDKDESRKRVWEKQCIRFMENAPDREARSFFMRQLNLIGSDVAVNALKSYAGSSEMCDDAVIALQSIGSDAALTVLASLLEAEKCPCAAQVMVALAERQYAAAVDSYISWSARGTMAEQAAALYAMASAGDPRAERTLMNAAAKASYQWEPGGAVQSLLLYARNRGLAGDVKTMEKITSQVITASKTPATANQRLAAMSVITTVKGSNAIKMLLAAADDPDVAIRGGALRLAVAMPGSALTKKWISRYAKVSPVAKPGILFMLGERGDALAVPLMKKVMYEPSQEAAEEAMAALAKLEGKNAVGPLLTWVLQNANEQGHRAAANVLTTILDSTSIPKVAEMLPSSGGAGTVTLIQLLAWSHDNRYFKEVYPYATSGDIAVRATALTSLASLASCDDQQQVISLLEQTKERAEVTELQRALLSAAMRCDHPSERSDIILNALDKSSDKLKLIPILAVTGGEAALKRVAYEFENGDAMTRDVCFDALSHWSDHTAARALYDICASGNKTFGRPAFDAYLSMVSVARLTPERKLLMVKDIAPYAAAPDAKIALIDLAASLKTRPAELFISSYYDDPSESVASAAVAAALSMELPEEEAVGEPKTTEYILTQKEKDEGFISLFNGRNLDGWVGDKVSYTVKDGVIVVSPGDGHGGNLFTAKEYSDFVFRFEFQLTEGANNGLGIRTPLEGDAAYVGMELQILDNTASIYANLKPYQYHGSVYGVISARRGFLRPVGDWNYEEVTVRGTKIRVVLNGAVIINGDIAGAIENGTLDGKEHPGLKNRSGHIGFLGHGSLVKFRNIRIREL